MCDHFVGIIQQRGDGLAELRLAEARGGKDSFAPCACIVRAQSRNNRPGGHKRGEAFVITERTDGPCCDRRIGC